MTRIAGWSPASRITTSKAAWPAWDRSSASGSSRRPTTPLITSAADALAVTLNEVGHVDLDRLAELLECDPDEALRQLGTRGVPQPDRPRRGKPPTPICPARCGPSWPRPKPPPPSTGSSSATSLALRACQPKDVPPSGITARLGAPWIPTDVIEAFARDVMGGEVKILHTEEIATWTVDGRALHRQRRRHVRMGHRAPACRPTPARRAQQRDTADLRHRDRRWQRAARSQRRGDRGGQGEAGQDQDRLHPMGLDRPRSRRPPRAHLQRLASTTWCRVTSTAAT